MKYKLTIIQPRKVEKSSGDGFYDTTEELVFFGNNIHQITNKVELLEALESSGTRYLIERVYENVDR